MLFTGNFNRLLNFIVSEGFKEMLKLIKSEGNKDVPSQKATNSWTIEVLVTALFFVQKFNVILFLFV